MLRCERHKDCRRHSAIGRACARESKRLAGLSAIDLSHYFNTEHYQSSSFKKENDMIEVKSMSTSLSLYKNRKASRSISNIYTPIYYGSCSSYSPYHHNYTNLWFSISPSRLNSYHE